MQWELYNPIKRWTDDGGATRERHFPALLLCIHFRSLFRLKGGKESESVKNVSLGFFDLEIGLVTDIF